MTKFTSRVLTLKNPKPLFDFYEQLPKYQHSLTVTSGQNTDTQFRILWLLQHYLSPVNCACEAYGRTTDCSGCV